MVDIDIVNAQSKSKNSGLYLHHQSCANADNERSIDKKRDRGTINYPKNLAFSSS